MISAIIPTCDRPLDFLLTAIQSAQTQSLPPHEVIVVDNGIRPVDAASLPPDVRLLRLPPRSGASRSRNFGAAMAQGTHLAFLDDDDWWDVDFLKETAQVLKAEGTRCVYGRKDVFRDGQVQRYKCPTPQTLTIPVLLRRNPGTGGQNLLIEKELFFHVGGFTDTMRVSNDKAFVLDVLLSGAKVSVAPAAAAVLRAHDGPRLRGERIQRLRFVWRYRRLYGPMGTLTQSAKIVSNVLLGRLRQSLRGARKD